MEGTDDRALVAQALEILRTKTLNLTAAAAEDGISMSSLRRRIGNGELHPISFDEGHRPVLVRVWRDELRSAAR